MKQMTRPEIDDLVVVQYPMSLINTALQNLATDSGKQAVSLSTMKQESLVRLGAGSR
jgi:hypothetical protein